MGIVSNSMQIIFEISIFVYWTNQTCWQEIDITEISDIAWSVLDYSFLLIFSQMFFVLNSVLVVISHADPNKKLHHKNPCNVDSVSTICNVNSPNLDESQRQERLKQDEMANILSWCKDNQCVDYLLLNP